MIYKRYYIRSGAKTTTGGIVKASSNFWNMDGAPVAREGDEVDCPACGKKGVIQCVMPRVPTRNDGKEYALSDDLCICGCQPPPKLVADQDIRYQTLAVASEEIPGHSESLAPGSGSRDAATGPAQDQSAASDNRPVSPEERPVRILNRGTGKPQARRPYRIALPGGRIVQGTTDAQGDTSGLSQSDRTSLRSCAGAQP